MVKEIFTEELKFTRVICGECGDPCKGHRLKISWPDIDPKPPNKIWIDGKVAYGIDDNEISTITHLKQNFPQNGPA